MGREAARELGKLSGKSEIIVVVYNFKDMQHKRRIETDLGREEVEE